MKKQTAVEWLLNELENKAITDYSFSQAHKIITLDIHYFDNLFEKANAMEREQIEKAYTLGREQWQKYEFAHSNYENDVEVPTPRKYYQQTYGGDK